MTEISSVDMELQTDNESKIEVKKPKRILHFSDGTLEEYSDSEDEEQQQQQNEKSEDTVDTASMSWGPWMLHTLTRTGSVALSACDYVGESLASFLGITTPKYQYELDEYHRMEKERKAEEENSSGWLNSDKKDEEENVETEQPVCKPTVNT